MSEHTEAHEFISKFRSMLGENNDPLRTFVGFFIVVRYFGINQLKEHNFSDDATYLKDLIQHENNEISELLNDLSFDGELNNLSNTNLSEIYSYIHECIQSQSITEEMIISNTLYQLLHESLSEQSFYKYMEDLTNIENMLRVFPVYRTDSLLVMLDESRAIFAQNLVLFYLSTDIDKIQIVSYDHKIFGETHYKKILSLFGNRKQQDQISRLQFKSDPLLNYNYLASILDNLDEHSFLLIIGINKFASLNKSKAISTTTFQDGKLNLHTPNTVNWNEFVQGIDHLFVKSKLKNINTTMIYTLDDVFNPAKLITDAALNVDSFDIYSITSSENVEVNQIYYLFNELSEGLIDDKEFDAAIAKNKQVIGDNNYYFALGIKCLIRNDYITAEEHFNSVLENMPPANQLIIANFYLNKKQYPKALEILVSLYEDDKYLSNLMPAILRAVTHLEDIQLFDEWLNKALQINNEDQEVIRYAANYLTNSERYLESAEKWYELYNLTNEIGIKLLHEINLILSNIDQHKGSEIEQLLMNYAENYPEIKSEVFFRLGLILYKDKKKAKEALEYFQKIDRMIDTPFAYEAALQRLHILKDKLSESNHSSKQKNLKEFSMELVDDIGILTYKDQGNFKWSKYIEDTLPYEEWKKQFIEIIFEKIEKWSKLDEDLFRQTNFSFDVDESIFDKVIQIEGQNYLSPTLFNHQLMLLFFTAIDLIAHGEFQKANDIIFTIFRLSSTAISEKDKKLAVTFGLLAWSSSNFKMGDEVESMAAGIASIEMGIECEEMVFPFVYAFNNIMDFLYNGSKNLQLDVDKKDSLCRLVDILGDRNIKLKYHYITNEYDYIIHNRSEFLKRLDHFWDDHPELEVLLNVPEEEEETFVNEIKILIDTYCCNGMEQKAHQYILKFSTSFHINIMNKISLSYKIYFEWAKILLHQKDYKHAKDFILLSIEQIEKIRTVYFKRERSFIGKQANTIYRSLLEIVGREFIESNDSALLNNLHVRNSLLNIAPRSIIEQKLFNNLEITSDERTVELIKANNDYYDLFYVLQTMEQKGVVDEEYEHIVNRFIECKRFLEENHPNFKPLPSYNILAEHLSADNFSALKSKLNDNELICQLVLLDNFLIYNIISKNQNEITVEEIDFAKCEDAFDVFKHDIYLGDYQLNQKGCNEAFIELCEHISSMLIKPLYKYLEENRYKKLFFMPDLNLTYMNMNYMRYKNKWLIEWFDSIENIIDFNVIGSAHKNDFSNRVVANFVNPQDRSISQIMHMIKRQAQIELQEVDSSYVEINDDLKSYIFVGHGISEVNGYDYVGAKVIKKSKKMTIHLDEYLQINGRIQNALVISCSSGTPVDDYAERNNGVWSSLFEKNISYILYCKWDVSIKYTNQLLEKILDLMNENNHLSLCEALIQSQRQLCSFHPILWAGLEVWKNE
ncbi:MULTISPECIES: tetratricopeptide repeat protein [unclassified Paenibacillus]|uniref:tetratricopeptide repeat protein n=1 Tax=unclassified Paenibacillus TaxID=185978 RepID=UPI00362AB542